MSLFCKTDTFSNNIDERSLLRSYFIQTAHLYFKMEDTVLGVESNHLLLMI